MVSLKIFFVIKLMSLRNYIHLMYYNLLINYNNIVNYYNGYHDIWAFITGYNIPVSVINIKNTVDCLWMYDNYKNTLTYKNSENIYKLSWLSATVKNENLEYPMDDFIEHFFIKTDECLPSLHMIFMCWCAHTKNWFTTDNITFRIFDDNGDELSVSINDLLITKNNKLYIKN